jgi:hypothetical protein
MTTERNPEAILISSAVSDMEPSHLPRPLRTMILKQKKEKPKSSSWPIKPLSGERKTHITKQSLRRVSPVRKNCIISFSFWPLALKNLLL